MELITYCYAVSDWNEMRGGSLHFVLHYFKANNKCLDPSFLMYCNVNSLYGLVMSQKLHMVMFELIEAIESLIEDFMKNYEEENDIGYIIGVHMK